MIRTKILAALSFAMLAPASGIAEELTLPFKDSFLPTDPIGLDDENPRWTVTDHNGDGYMYTWTNYNEKGMGGAVGYLSCLSHYMNSSDDYVVSKPVHIEAGTIHLSFYYRVTSESEPASFDVQFGNAGVEAVSLPVVKSMENVTNPDWELFFLDIDVPETGDYTLAIHNRSTSQGHMLRIDELEMDYGKYQGRPDMVAVTAELPLPAYNLGEETTLKFTVTNKGGATADGFDAAYSVNDGEWISQHFTDRVDPGQELTVEFNQKASFATADTRYDVRFKTQATDDMWDFNDQCAGVVRNVSSKIIPYEVKFADIADKTSLDVFWWPSDFEQAGWKFNNSSYRQAVLTPSPLVSGGIELDAGEYRLNVKTMAGSWGWPDNETSDYTVKMGLTGTDMSQWKTVVERKDLYTNDASSYVEDRIRVDEAGTYSFSLYVDRNPNQFYFDGFSIDYANPDDISARYGSQWPMAAQVPAKMLSGMTVPVNVENIGRNTEEVTLDAVINGEPVTEPVKVQVAVGGSVTMELPVNTGTVNVGDEIVVTVNATMEAEDGTPDNNCFDVRFTVSDEVLQRDNITDFSKSHGNGEPAGFKYGYGSAFHLTGTSVLSGVDLVLAELEGEKIPFTLNVYSIGEGNIGRLLAANSLERDGKSGVTRFGITPLRLTPGDYFFEIVQAGDVCVGICQEAAEDGTYETRSEWFLNPELFDPDEIRSNEGYTLGIRPVFADGAEAPAVNLQAVEFLAPLAENLMFDDEPVTVVYNSLGYEKLENVQFSCFVDGIPAASTTVPTIEPYGLKFKIDFNVDLTELGEHTITVIPSVSDDVDMTDNIITKKVNSIPEVDRYTLDFESCNDFATRFNPSWYTVDGDGVPTNGIMVAGFGIWWPGCDEPFGFVAFNPDETIPLAPGFFTGYNGKRFGASFFTSTGVPNDDWLISPPLQLGDKPVLKFRCKSQTDKYGMEEYYVLVSPEGSDKLEDFVPVGEKRFAPAEWEDVKVDLSEYAGKSPRVAIHCVSEDKFIFLIDDIAVEADDTDSLVETKESHATVLWDAQSGMLHATASADATVEHIDVFAVSGMNIAGFDTEGSSVSVKLGDLPSGTYICRVLLSDGSSSSVKIPVR